MSLAKSALELFIRSLPRACKVSIIGFGSRLDLVKADEFNIEDEGVSSVFSLND